MLLIQKNRFIDIWSSSLLQDISPTERVERGYADPALHAYAGTYVYSTAIINRQNKYACRSMTKKIKSLLILWRIFKYVGSQGEKVPMATKLEDFEALVAGPLFFCGFPNTVP